MLSCLAQKFKMFMQSHLSISSIMDFKSGVMLKKFFYANMVKKNPLIFTSHTSLGEFVCLL